MDVLQAVVESYILLGRTLEPTNPVGFYKEQLEDHVLEQVFKHYEERCVNWKMFSQYSMDFAT